MENEFLDIIQDLVTSNWSPEFKAKMIKDSSQPLFFIILRLYWHILYSNIRGSKGILHFCQLAIDECKRILLNKDDE